MTSSPPVREALLAAARDELTEHGHAGISLRAVARRAGVSHAAPKHHFGDRGGLLTAVAAEGFDALTAALTAALGDLDDDAAPAAVRLAALGRAYVQFGLRHPALFDLMFRPAELHPDDPTLTRSRQRSLSVLSAAVTELAPSELEPSGTPDLALLSWALAHGLVVLARDGALPNAAGRAPEDTSLPLGLIGLFSQSVAGDDGRHTP
ncbi:TetR/AcrR family transcriptional regulator [[Mycobacterium] burgundiense]|uniref:TetR/AcrR family transcriptional regulator n=1 Tax=[Mycobacterium] burgundiense TaxID=3064286 RepID=A0ABM9LJ48_9MYCO|nr:TetR/AcrR family transcriptional regulator [Mycolicibacterium sp. MU0053]CAJ1499902.1 TetR/AcrR family transcriptional regulator [Mycolicibacterium sp. MU0053]